MEDYNIPGQIFLLTRPLRDVTFIDFCCDEGIIISTHTPLAGRDNLKIS